MSQVSFGNTEDLLQYIDDTELEYATIGFIDYQGSIRSKYVSRKKLLSAINGIGFPLATFAFDAGDSLLEAPHIAERDDQYGDSPARLDPSSARILPGEDSRRNLFMLADFIDEAAPYCPRSLYKRVFGRCRESGLTMVHGIELEFTLFNESPQSAANKDWKGLQTATRQKTYYSYQQQLVQTDFYNDLMDACKTLGIDLDALHEESGAGFMEAVVSYGSGASIPDNAALFKAHCKAIAAKHDQLASFMARWSEHADGQSGHIHMSILDEAGRNVFFDPEQQDSMSKTMRHFIGGLQKLLPEFLLMLAPNINSYKRLVPGIFAPISAEWGIENRTCSLRAIPGSPTASRVECRTPGADANPYLALAALMAAGLYGIENQVEPSQQTTNNAYNNETPDHLKFPRDFRDAIEMFSGSDIAREQFGDEFVEAYAGTRHSQAEQFQSFVTQQELERFFDLI